MTIESTVNRIQYDGDDVTLGFAFPYLFFDETHLTVILTSTTGVDTTLTLTTHYTVTGEGVAGGGTVTMVTEPATNEVLTIIRDVPYTQPSNYTNSGTFDQETLEQDLDELTMMAQQLKELSDRSIKLPPTSDLSDQILPAPVADQLLGWNAGATALENKLQTDGTVTVPTGAANAKKALRYTTTGLALEDGPKMDFDPVAADAFKVLAIDSAGAEVEMVHSLFRSYLAGLGISNGTDAVNDIDIALGVCRDFADSVNMKNAAAMGKQIDAVWAAGGTPGTPLGGFPSGLSSGSPVNDTWYYFFALWNPSTGVFDAGFDTSLTATNLLADATGYTKYRRIGAILYGTATIVAFFQYGDTFLWDTRFREFGTSDPGTSVVDVTLTLPTGLNLEALVSLHIQDSSPAAATSLLITNNDQTDGTPSVTLYDLIIALSSSPEGNSTLMQYPTNTSAQIRYRLDQSNADIFVSMTAIGWVDSRGRND